MPLKVLLVLFIVHAVLSTPLDDYVHKFDPAYSYTLLSTTRIGEVEVHTINMTSQTWLTTKEVSQPLWYHYILLYIPDRLTIHTSLLHITGGANTNVPKPDPQMAIVANTVSSVLAELHEIPNQPLRFTSDPLGLNRTEDGVIAFGWKMFLNTLDPIWLPRLPMVKASVRTMDTVQDYMSKHKSFQVDNFVAMGASKRGWTTWLVGAVDTKRVIAIVPIVIDVLNCVKVFDNIYSDLACHWPEAFQDYIDQGITERFNTPEFKKLAEIIDPLVYNERLANTKKYIVNAGDDEFFQPDGSLFSFSDLKGDKLLRYVPNAPHSLKGSDALFSILSYYYGISRNVQMPNIQWKLENYTSAGAYLTVYIDKKASKITLWQATNTAVRDFRMPTVGKPWVSSPINTTQDSYTIQVKNPPKGWTAFMIEVEYANYYSQAIPPLKFTTSAYITPNTYPTCT
jgi:PhoPQ-activated pathogenicity-related protein